MKQLVCVAFALYLLACDDSSGTANTADAAARDAAQVPAADAASNKPDAMAARDAADSMDAANNADADVGRDAARDSAVDGPDAAGDADIDAAANPGADAAADAATEPDADAGGDAGAEDGALADAAPAVATHTGAIDVLEVRLRNMGGAGVDGYGVQVGISFVANEAVVPPLLEQQASVIGCKVRQLTPQQLAQAQGIDEGPVQITVTDGSPAFPSCRFLGVGVGYLCPDVGSSGTGGALSAVGAPAGTSLFTATGTATFGAEDVGRYLRLGATGVNALNTSLPIVAVVNSTTVALATGAGVTLALLPSASFATLAGVGPAPGVAASNFFSNGEQLTVSKPDSSNFAAFPVNAGLPGAQGVGDEFTLGTSNSKVLPTTIPTDGSAFTIGCDDAPSCGTSLASALDIITTDAPVQGMPPFSFPSPITKRVHIHCVNVAGTTVTVPAGYAAYLTQAMSGATRIRVLFSRINVSAVINQSAVPNVTNVSGGHAELGFVTPS